MTFLEQEINKTHILLLTGTSVEDDKTDEGYALCNQAEATPDR